MDELFLDTLKAILKTDDNDYVKILSIMDIVETYQKFNDVIDRIEGRKE